MAIAKCPVCGRDVSDQAESCPNCGHPLKNSSVQTIQQTSKQWKLLTIGSIVLIVVGLASLGRESFGIGQALLAFCFIIFFAARVGAWWTNG